MIGNYLKSAWRGITKRKFYSILNISGLAIGIICCALIYLYTSYQLSFDSYHRRANSIFRVVYELHLQKTEYNKGGSIALYEALKAETPVVSQAAVSVTDQSFIVDINSGIDKRFKEEKDIAFTSSAWFNLFTCHWLSGNPSQLDRPNTAAVTEKLATKYFGGADPMGKTISINNRPVKIIGVIADSPYNTDLKSEMYISFLSIRDLMPKVEPAFFTDWGYLMSTNSIFVSLADPHQKAVVEKELARLTKVRLGDGSKYFVFKLLPLAEQHFDARYGGKIQKSMLVILAVLGLLIMIIACINYINMMIAGQARRSVEIGTRKVLGGSAGQLFMQFMAESLLNVVIAMVIAVAGMILILPLINNFLFSADPVYILSYGRLLLFFVILLVIITAGAGIYPALILSRMNVFQALKNNMWNIQAGFSRKMLVIFQNTVTQMLIACTVIIIMQVHFLTNTDKGFDRKMVLMVPVGEISASQKEQLRQSLTAIPGVQYFSFCNNSPSSDSHRGATVKFNDRPWEKWPARFAVGDSAYCRTFGIQLVAGRNIRTHTPVPEYLVNETMVKRLNVNDNDVLGKSLIPGDVKGVIAGVVKDFNVRSLAEPIEPTVLLNVNELQTNLAIKLAGNNATATLNRIQKEYNRALPGQVFSYQFIDDEIAGLYTAQILQQKLIWCATVVAIFISSLGLLGLFSLITIQRTKEIGIRKVLGASVTNIITMLSKEYLALVLIALIIASPVAWWIMGKWLQNFAFRIQISWWIFVAAGLAAGLTAILTVGMQSIKTALANPVDSLRNE